MNVDLTFFSGIISALILFGSLQAAASDSLQEQSTERPPSRHWSEIVLGFGENTRGVLGNSASYETDDAMDENKVTRLENAFQSGQCYPQNIVKTFVVSLLFPSLWGAPLLHLRSFQ